MRNWLFLCLLGGSCLFASEDEGEFCFEAKYLAMKATQEDTQVGSLYQDTFIDPPNRNAKSDVKSIDLKSRYEPGLRLIAGYKLPCSSLRLGVGWTYLKGNFQVEKKLSQPVFDPNYREYLWGEVSYRGGRAFEYQSNAYLKASNRFSLNAYDLLASFDLRCWDRLKVTPILGLRALQLNQVFNKKFDSYTSFLPSFLAQYQNSYKGKYDYLGYGVLGGLGLVFDIDCGFYFKGEGKASWVFGRAHRSSYSPELSYFPAESFSFRSDQYVHQRAKKVSKPIAVSEYALGMGWSGVFCDVNASLEVAFEELLVFDGLWSFLEKEDQNFGFSGVSISGCIEF